MKNKETTPTKRRELELCLKVKLRKREVTYCGLMAAEEMTNDICVERPYLWATYNKMSDRAFRLMVDSINKALVR